MKTCLIFRTDRIGDMACSIPALYMCRFLLPQHTIVLVASDHTVSLVNNLECVDTVIANLKVFTDSLNKGRFTSIEYVIAMNQSSEIIEHIKTIRAPYSIGIKNSFESFFLFNKGRFAKHFLQKEKNESQRMLNLVRNINPKQFDALCPTMPNIRISYEEKHKKKVHDFFDTHNLHNKKIICLNPIKEGASKSVPDNMYPLLLKHIEDAFPNNPILILGVEQDMERIHSFIQDSACKNILVYTCSYDLLDSVALIDSISVFLGSSTGPTHISAMLNKDTIAFYPYDKKHAPSRWGSFTKGNVHYILSKGNVDAKENMHHKDLFSKKHIEETIVTLKKYLNTPT
ncbi:MAG: glycosyltransferase family 9 protein [Desulfovibrionaceae bacterium]